MSASELFNRAEKELAAFVAAVNTLHGEEQARAAADDWLLELIALEEPFKGASLDLRAVTISAARRLARCLSTPSPAHAAQAGIEQDSGHRSKNSHNSLSDVQFTQGCAESPRIIIGQN